MSELIGRTLGQYRIVEQIGEGGMATVYKAHQPSLNRYVALKVLPPVHAKQPGFTERFRREAEAIANLHHPNILPVYDSGQEEGYSYIVMRYIEGARTLKEVMTASLDLAQIADLIGQIAAALDHAHQRGVIHRDVKPSNVLMDGDWALLGDFGLAKMTEASVKLTGSGVGVGTPAYMSPEQGQGAELDHRTDIYSLGIILFEMLTGRIPHDAETPLAIVLRRVTEPLPVPRTIDPNIPEPVEAVILKALSREPQNRFASAGAMADALRQAVSQTAVPVAEGQGWPPGVEEPPIVHQSAEMAPHWQVKKTPPPQGWSPAPTQAPAKPTFPWIPAGRWVLGIGAAVLVIGLCAVGVVIALVVRGQPTPTPATSVAALAAMPATPTATHTPLPVSTDTPQPAPTDTPKPAVPTATDTPASTSSPTSIPEPTWTPVPTSTPEPTSTPQPTSTPIPTATPVPTPTLTPTPCALGAGDRFGTIWNAVQAKLGCPLNSAYPVYGAGQAFEHGYMLWRSDNTTIYVLLEGGKASSFADTFQDGVDPEKASLSPPAGKQEPIRGFGMVWREHLGGASSDIGWALADEYVAPNLVVQDFVNGLVFWEDKVGNRVVYASGEWEQW
jgi:serine/threonine protein kinase